MTETTQKSPHNDKYWSPIHFAQKLPQVGETITAQERTLFEARRTKDMTVVAVERTPLRECDLPRLDGIEIRESADVIDEHYEVTCETEDGERVRFVGWVSNLEHEPLRK